MRRYFEPIGLVALLMVSVYLMGCAATRPPEVEEVEAPPEGISMVPQDESFDPLSLEDEDLIKLPPSQLKWQPERTASRETLSDVATGAELKEIPGFRVQIFASREEFDARQVEKKALLEFEQAVYLIFESPNYKVRVGDCKTRQEANQLKEIALELGYGEAWVVQSKVLSAER